jgi:group I intron endonuclease
MFIYKITNKINNKVYVGKTVLPIEERYKKHLGCAKNKVNRRLYDSMNHHGYENFELSLLEVCDNAQQLSEREIYWIDEYNSQTPNGYNMTSGGDGGNTIAYWKEEDKLNLWASQAKTRTGMRRNSKVKKRMSAAATKREASRSESERKHISDKISTTLKQKYKSGELKANTPKLYGKDHPHFIDVDIDVVLALIFECNTLKQISETLGVSPYGVRSRLIEKTGKNYLEWRKEYGIVGPLSKPRRTC